MTPSRTLEPTYSSTVFNNFYSFERSADGYLIEDRLGGRGFTLTGSGLKLVVNVYGNKYDIVVSPNNPSGGTTASVNDVRVELHPSNKWKITLDYTSELVIITDREQTYFLRFLEFKSAKLFAMHITSHDLFFFGSSNYRAVQRDVDEKVVHDVEIQAGEGGDLKL